MWFYQQTICPKDADGMADGVDPDLGPHCLLRTVCAKFKIIIVINVTQKFKLCFTDIIWAPLSEFVSLSIPS